MTMVEFLQGKVYKLLQKRKINTFPFVTLAIDNPDIVEIHIDGKYINNGLKKYLEKELKSPVRLIPM